MSRLFIGDTSSFVLNINDLTFAIAGLYFYF